MTGMAAKKHANVTKVLDLGKYCEFDKKLIGYVSFIHSSAIWTKIVLPLHFYFNRAVYKRKNSDTVALFSFISIFLCSFLVSFLPPRGGGFHSRDAPVAMTGRALTFLLGALFVHSLAAFSVALPTIHLGNGHAKLSPVEGNWGGGGGGGVLRACGEPWGAAWNHHRPWGSICSDLMWLSGFNLRSFDWLWMCKEVLRLYNVWLAWVWHSRRGGFHRTVKTLGVTSKWPMDTITCRCHGHNKAAVSSGSNVQSGALVWDLTCPLQVEKCTRDGRLCY